MFQILLALQHQIEISSQAAAQRVVVFSGSQELLRLRANVLIEVLGNGILLRTGSKLCGQGRQVREIGFHEPGRISPPLLLDLFTPPREKPIQWSDQSRVEELAEERRVNLGAAVVVRADEIQIRVIGQRVLCDDSNVAPVEFLVFLRLAIVRRETFRIDDVLRAEASRVSATEEDRVLGHLGIDWLAVFLGERRAEHVVAEPITEPVIALLAVEPMIQASREGHEGEKAEHDQQRAAPAIERQRANERQRDGHQQEIGENGQTELILLEGLSNPVGRFRNAHPETGPTVPAEVTGPAGAPEIILAGCVHKAVESQQQGGGAARQAP